MTKAPLRIGVLGCASVADYALLEPAKNNENVLVTAIASRSIDRARDYAVRYGIGKSYGSYEELLASTDIDAIYIPLPAALHHVWAIAAMEAGLPVLCEKPIASNAGHAIEMARVSVKTGVPLVEAMHWKYHPLANRILEILHGGAIGKVLSIDVWLKAKRSMVGPGDIRLDYHLGGGSLLDMGCYCMSLMRLVAGAEPIQIVEAQATLLSQRVDGAMTAKLRFPNQILATIQTSMCEPENSGNEAQRISDKNINLGARIVGETGELYIDNPFLPGFFNSKIELLSGGVLEVEYPVHTSSYAFQLESFVKFIRGENPIPISMAESVANMESLDSIYRVSGLGPRP